jgi:hypothetical protein
LLLDSERDLVLFDLLLVILSKKVLREKFDARKYAYEREMIFSPNGFNDIETEKLQTKGS